MARSHGVRPFGRAAPLGCRRHSGTRRRAARRLRPRRARDGEANRGSRAARVAHRPRGRDARRACRRAWIVAAAARGARAARQGRAPDHRRTVAAMSTLPVSVITGFLGSGKTTLLSRLLRDPAFERTAVIINEFGAVGLDHLLVESSDEQIVTLEGGCVCCTVRGDLVRTAGDLLARRAAGSIPRFERIVIETTGLADPAPIVHALMTDRDIANALRLESVIATVDAAAGAATLDAHPESVKQAALADCIVITKSDLADPAANGLAERLQALNPGAPKLTAVHGAVDATRLFDGRARYDPTLYEAPAHRHGGINTFCLRREEPLHAATLSLFLQVAAEHCGAKLLRLKGLVDVVESPGRPAVIHGVQHVFHPPTWLDAWPDEERSTRIVVISQGLDAQWLRDLLEVLDDEVKACSIS